MCRQHGGDGVPGPRPTGPVLSVPEHDLVGAAGCQDGNSGQPSLLPGGCDGKSCKECPETEMLQPSLTRGAIPSNLNSLTDVIALALIATSPDWTCRQAVDQHTGT